MSSKEPVEDLRAAAEARVAEAKVLLRQAALSSFLMAWVAAFLVKGFAVVVPIGVGMLTIAGWRYWRAKRELAALDKPPEARLLR